jgi:homoaconitase/3-isopropylmalate dehydratase large subunit
MMLSGVSEMENKEKSREKVLVPVRHQKPTQEKKHAEEQNKARAWKMPRRWHTY